MEDQSNNIAFTTEEELLLRAIDPKYKHIGDIKAQMSTDQDNSDFINNIQDLTSYNREFEDEQIDPIIQRKYKKQVEGGFVGALALGALSAAAGPLISMALDAIKSKIQKNKEMKATYRAYRGRGIYAPNTVTKGYGTNPPNGRGMVKDFFNQNMDKLKRVENELSGLSGKAFYDKLITFVKDATHKIANTNLATIAKPLTDLTVNKLIPASFQKIIATRKKPVGSGKIKDKMSSLAKPLIKWTLSKFLNSSFGKKGSEKLNDFYGKIKRSNDFIQNAKNYDAKWGGATLKHQYKKPKKTNFWKSVKNFGSKVLKTTLPGLLGKAAPAVGTAIDAIMSKMGVTSTFGKEVAQSIGKSLLDTAKQSAEDYAKKVDEVKRKKGRNLTPREKAKLKKETEKEAAKKVKNIRKEVRLNRRFGDDEEDEETPMYDEEETSMDEEEMDDDDMPETDKHGRMIDDNVDEDGEIIDERFDEDGYPITKKPISKPTPTPTPGNPYAKYTKAQMDEMRANGMLPAGMGKRKMIKKGCGKSWSNFTVRTL